MRPIKRVLIANRGEIAVRIIRSLREMGIESVAVYSDADAASTHRRLADFAVRLPGVASIDTYLKIPALIDAIKRSGADAVHPGYGFLSENTAFATAVTESGVKFIGPPASAMEAMGNKINARELMKKHGVPVVPGASEPIKDDQELKRLAKDIGFPLILKAAHGGGGRGMRIVRQDSELSDAFAACQREALAYFGNKDVFCERYIDNPRHIEFQVLFDEHGHGVHLFERDCSVQRRHQKLLEEAPSSFLSHEQRMKIGNNAVAAARAAGYAGAGTIEFICESPDRAYFMEMNTRIQVEHPVTEMITGLDLIAWQVRVAAGERLPFQQEDLTINGWSMEARINTEDPARDFAPGPGLLTRLELPMGPNVRVDTHVYAGYRIPETYDSMVAKVITWGKDRDECRLRMLRALAETRLDGVPTTAKFHEALLKHPQFIEGKISTKFIEQNTAYFNNAFANAGDAGGSSATSETDDAAVALAAALAVNEDWARARTNLTVPQSNWNKATWTSGGYEP